MRNIYVKLKNSVEHMGKVALLESGVKKAKSLPSMDGMGKTPATGVKQVPSSSGSGKKHHFGVTSVSIDKRYKLMVKSKTTQSPETIKNVLKTNHLQ